MRAALPFVAPVLAPVVVAALLAVALRRRPLRARGAVVAALSAWAGYVAVSGAPPMWPVEAADHLFPLGAVAVAAGALSDRLAARPWATIAGVAVLGAAWLRWLADPLVQWTWSGAEAAGWIAGLAALWAAAWGGAVWAASAVPARAVPGPVAVAAAFGAAALAATGSVKLGQLEGALAAGLGVYAMFGLRWPDLQDRAAAAAAVPLSTLLLTAGVLYSETPPAAGAVLALAPLGIAAGRRDRSGFPWRSALACAAVGAAGLALALALSPAPPDPSSYGQY